MTRRHHKRMTCGAVAGLMLVAVAAVWLLAGGNGSTTPSTSVGTPSPHATLHVAEPAGANPSKSAQMVCASATAKEIASALGVTTINPLAPTWVNHVYQCQYAYPDGVIAVSVKELSNPADTTTYFKSLRTQLGQRERLKGVAQGAFVTNDGSFVLRKDYKVLVVDTSGLPSQFGSPPQAKKDVAIGVALTVLGCWTGA